MRRLDGHLFAEVLYGVARRLDYLRLLGAPGGGDLSQDGGESGLAEAIYRREVSATEEWL
jgi:hypothetical protein